MVSLQLKRAYIQGLPSACDIVTFHLEWEEMQPCRIVISLGVLSWTAWSTMVPVTLHTSRSGLLAARHLPQPLELLRPTHEIEMLYADGTYSSRPLTDEANMGAIDAATDLPLLVKVLAKHESKPYVFVEQFEDQLLDISCSSRSPGNDSTVLSMRFTSNQTFTAAIEQWSEKKALMFITHHTSCNHDVGQREVYQ